MEVAHVQATRPQFVASGTQLGATYELRYRLAQETLRLQLVGEGTVDLNLAGADFFDLGWSPLFNSLPVIRDGCSNRAHRATIACGGSRSPRSRPVCPSNATSLSEVV
jgi:hypothetical protein